MEALSDFMGEAETLPEPTASSDTATEELTPHVKHSLLKSASVNRYHDDTNTRVMTKSELGASYPRQWIFDDLITANGMWLLAGKGGLGKSRLGLAIAMSAAAGIPVGPFRPANPDGIRVMMLTQEDDDAEKGHRYTTQLRWFQEHYPRWGDDNVVPRLGKNLFLPEIDPATGLSDELILELAADQAVNGPYQLIVWDPLILFWRGEEDDGLNSATGARKTLNELMAITRTAAKRANVMYSVLYVHHLNKNGSVLGSVMVENLVRTVLKLEEDEAAVLAGITNRATLRIDKANGIPKQGETTMYLETPAAVVHFKGDFETLTREQRVADAIARGFVESDCTPKTLVSRLATSLPMLGETATERKTNAQEVLDAWATQDDLALSSLGIRREGEGEALRFYAINSEEQVNG